MTKNFYYVCPDLESREFEPTYFETFRCASEFLHKVLNEHPNYRFYKKEDELIRLKNNQYIAVNTQWGNTGYSRPHFQKFLEHIRHFYHVYSR